jgi:hypothetical protein
VTFIPSHKGRLYDYGSFRRFRFIRESIVIATQHKKSLLPKPFHTHIFKKSAVKPLTSKIDNKKSKVFEQKLTLFNMPNIDKWV